MERPERWLLCLALFAIESGVAESARAIPIVYTAGGQLGTTFTGDVIHFNNATVRLTMHADTGDAPISTAAITGGVEAHYRPSSGLLEITDRPGGAPDLSIPYTPDLVTVNLFEPSAQPDRFEIRDGVTTQVPGASSFYVGGFRVSFIGASILPGTDPAPLPGFDITGGAVVFGVFYDLDRVALYSFGDATLESEVVPEPDSALLLGLGLAALAGIRARRRRSDGGAGSLRPPEERTTLVPARPVSQHPCRRGERAGSGSGAPIRFRTGARHDDALPAARAGAA